MDISRRSLITGLISLVAAPAVIRLPSLLMPIKPDLREFGIIVQYNYGPARMLEFSWELEEVVNLVVYRQCDKPRVVLHLEEK